MDLAGKRVVITGASAGIGRAAAIEFAKRGAVPVLVARGGDRLAEAAAEAGPGASSVTCDVSDPEQVARMAREAGDTDILVNNAGFAIYGRVAELSSEEIESQMRTNYLGAVYCTKEFLPAMLERGSGHIVNVASVAASMGLPGMAAYCASKHAMLGFSEGLRHELHGTGVGVTVVSPIMVRTGFFDGPSFERMRGRSRMSLDPQTVARAVVRAAGSPRLEIAVPRAARAAIWLKQAFPYAISPLLGRAFRSRL